MSTSLFGLTAASLRKHMFPQWNDFSAMSQPDDTTVDEIIEGQAGELAAKLYKENIDAASIPDDVDSEDLHSPAWLWCLETLKLMAALRVLEVATQSDPALAQKYEKRLTARFEDLNSSGAAALGDEALDSGDSPSAGPTTHINQFGLTTLAAEDMSSLEKNKNLLSRDDEL